MKYKKQIVMSALAISLLVGGSSVFAATPQDLGIKGVASTYYKQGVKTSKTIKGNSVVGTVLAISDTGFTVEVKNAKTKKVSSIDVKTDTTTVYTKNGVKATVIDLAVGQKVIVMGKLDKTTSTITAKKVKITTIIVAHKNSKVVKQ